MTIFWFILGFIILVGGANFLIDGAASLGRRLNIPPIIIGLTIISLGTSLPELVISVLAASKGETDLAISNVLGSNTANILLILGFAALIQPIKIYFKKIRLATYFSIVAVVVLGLFSSTLLPQWWGKDEIRWPEGTIFLLFFAIFIYYAVNRSKEPIEETYTQQKDLPVVKSVIYIVLGLTGLYFGGKWIVDGTQHIAELAGLSMSTIGIKIVAVATSLPELVASVVAAFKKHSDIAVGNVIGSNIFNIFLVLGLSALIHPLQIYDGLFIDITMVILSTVILITIILTGKGKQITRIEGFLFLVIYAAFLLFRERIIALV